MTSELNEQALKKCGSTEFVHAMTSQMNREHLDGMINMQREALSRFEKTNEMLSNCCTLSSGRLNAARKELALYCMMINDMKKDLDSIFRRLRAHKQNFAQAYPQAFAKSAEKINQQLQEEEDEEKDENEKEKSANA